MARVKSTIGALTDAEEAAIQAGIAQDPDNPEMTDLQLAGLRPAQQVLPAQLYNALVKRARGRPPSDAKKIEVKLRLDPHVVEAFKADGPGWQTRMNAALARAVPPDAKPSDLDASKRSARSGEFVNAGAAARPTGRGVSRKRTG